MKNIRDGFFNLLSFMLKACNFLEKRLRLMGFLEFQKCFKNTYFLERRQTATSEIPCKNQNSSTR